VIITIAVTMAFEAGLNMEREQQRRQGQQDPVIVMQREITRMLEGAKLSEVTASSANATPTATGSTYQTYFQSDQAGSGADELGTDRITFTTAAPGIPLEAQYSQDDFETQQQSNNGPIAGMAEVSFGTTPIGNPPGDPTGLFERVQRPADSDATQGGNEFLICPQIARMGFQFWDGAEWISTWDSTTTPYTNHLPAAVLVSYILVGDSQQTVHTFTVPIFTSDVTALNPVSGTTS
jgi:hypothetical protein